MVFAVAVPAVVGQSEKDSGGVPLAYVAAIEGVIGPSTTYFVSSTIAEAEERDANVLVLRLATPGGLATSMRDIITEILSTDVPVVGYVAPPGTHAASAGTYILYATSLAAMAPGTNLGAATPIAIGGGLPELPKPETPDEKEDNKTAPDDNPASAKAVNDAAAFIRSLADLHGRNAEWAEKAVREAASLSATEALEIHVIDLVAADIPTLLDTIDGRLVVVNGKKVTLATRGATIERVEPSTLVRALGILSNPNVALILMAIGLYGLIFELANPGSIGPGVVGVICLVLGLYALNQLPLNYTGLALIGLGIAFMAAEALTPSFGVLGIGGLISFAIGAAIVIDTDIEAFRISWWAIGGTALVSAALLTVLLGYLWRAQGKRPVDNVSRLVDVPAKVLDWAGGEGHVWAEGERWRARGDGDFKRGEMVRIARLDGLTLVVASSSAKPITPGMGASTGGSLT